MRKYEMTTLTHLPTNAWLVNRGERDRFNRMVIRWKSENPKASLFQETLAEDVIRLHILEQRLHDVRYFFDGTATSVSRAAPHESQMAAECIHRKQIEFRDWWGMIHRAKVELYKLALSNNVSVNLSGTVKDITSLFKACDTVGKTETTE